MEHMEVKMKTLAHKQQGINVMNSYRKFECAKMLTLSCNTQTTENTG